MYNKVSHLEYQYKGCDVDIFYNNLSSEYFAFQLIKKKKMIIQQRRKSCIGIFYC